MGEPERRFEEDALRMFRALRFSAKLGFRVEEETLRAIGKKAPLAGELSAERVRDEVEKILLSPAPETVQLLMAEGLLTAYAQRPIAGAESFAVLSSLPRKALDRWAGLSFILLRQGCIRSAETFLTGLRLDSRTVRCCAQAEEILSRPMPAEAVGWKRLLSRWGVDAVSCAAGCADAVFGGRRKSAVKAVLKSGDCFSVRHLAVNGDDLLDLGVRGREIGEALERLLDYVIERPEENRRETLLKLAKERTESRG